MTVETVAVTGGNGKIGTAILDHLSHDGYRTVNVARGKRREDVSDEYLTADLLDAGEVYGALARSGADAVIHMGTIPGPTEHPGYVTYESNVRSSYHILEAAEALELESVCLPSSVNAIGSAHQGPPAQIEYLPVDEDHPRTPHDPYGLSKHVVEVTADGFGRREGPPSTISSLRYPWVCTPQEQREMIADTDRGLQALRNAWKHTTRDVLFSYLDIEDAAEIARLCIEADFEGHEIFWAVAADTTAAVPSEKLITEYYPDADTRGSISGYESLIDIGKAREMLEWEPKHSWRDR